MSKSMEMEGLFPLPLDSTWTLLSHHIDEDRVREIHPWILNGRVVREGPTIVFEGLRFPQEKAAVREVRLAGRRSTASWRYRIDPPRRFGYEILFETGSAVRLDNEYNSVPGGTHVRTIAKISIEGIPDRLAAWVVGRTLNRADREDLEYARAKGL